MHHRIKASERAHRILPIPCVKLIGLTELADLVMLGNVCLRLTDAAKRIFYVGIYCRHLLARCGHCRHHSLSGNNGEKHNKGDHREHYQGKIQIYTYKHHKRAYKHKNRKKQILRPVVSQLRNVKKVV